MAREANHCSRAAPKTCCFDKELDAILCGNSTSAAKSPVDTLVRLEVVDLGPNPEDKVMDEEVKLEDDVEYMAGSSGGTVNQDLFSTLEGLASPSCLSLARMMQERRALLDSSLSAVAWAFEDKEESESLTQALSTLHSRTRELLALELPKQQQSGGRPRSSGPEGGPSPPLSEAAAGLSSPGAAMVPWGPRRS
ncbi:hypothetical protein UY3_08622 [Chelonia mydas]|uniref:Uncharacterized protein n=1 Tax=Chelonia mydas TaxID=8469 RepID=M7BQ41_CHEMY|nr:hypothetical protein UY3_08622 [Chelonia mydas]